MSDIGHVATTGQPASKIRSPHLRLVAVSASPHLTAGPAAVELEHVSKVYGDRHQRAVAAVADIDLTIEAGSAVLLMGPSGSGKTTVLGLVGCMVRPTSGRIRIDGHDVTRLSEDRLAELRRRRIGFVFQKHHLINGASALANVMLPALPLPGVNGDLRGRADSLLARFGLAGRARERVERLSGGEQQRVAIARALINEPRLIIADEPTAHLDSNAARDLLDLIETLLSGGRTVLVASHDPVLCDSGRFSRVYRLRDGRLIRGEDRP